MFRNEIDESQYCASDPNGRGASCRGDSGGSLQTAQTYSNPVKVVGVVSFNVGCDNGIISIGLHPLFGQMGKFKHHKSQSQMMKIMTTMCIL